jgi:hypothetical protein
LLRFCWLAIQRCILVGPAPARRTHFQNKQPILNDFYNFSGVSVGLP